jgi:uncharacterized protein YfaA (DUF2138 family)
MAFPPKKIAVLASICVAAVGIVYFAISTHPPFKGRLRAPAQGFEFSRPDALIRSSSLSRLPPDLLRIPLARDVLSEDFVDYYEHNENREALLGALKRVAYEHRLDLSEQLLEKVFSEPAELALWRDEGGRLKNFALAMKQNALARLIRLLLPLTDAQVSSAGTLKGTDVPILVVEYGSRHRLLMAARGDRVVALSDPGMLLKPGRPAAGREAGQSGQDGQNRQDDATAAAIAELLDEKAISPFARHFQSNEALPARAHEIILGAPVLALGYARFVPDWQGARLVFDDAGHWRSAALLDAAAAKRWNASALWRAMPHGAAFCAAVPVEWPSLMDAFAAWRAKSGEKPLSGAEKKALGEEFEPLAAVCWYQDERFYAPLFAAQFRAPAQKEERLRWLEWTTRMTRAEHEIRDGTRDGSWIWEGKITSRYGKMEKSDEGGEASYLTPTLAIQSFTFDAGKPRDFFFFSPEAGLVKKARDVADKKFPALADTAREQGGAGHVDKMLAVIDPAALAALARTEVFAALPRGEEADFRNAADAYLVPRLTALAKFPAQRVRLRASASAPWYPLEWSGQ